mmetsp:Transcript_59549/g.166293  ORF Transcript_59549/g.166293 Transcript_59549/m.166293 type:complete len:222 (+) Transcript_59549:288-953(+)
MPPSSASKPGVEAPGLRAFSFRCNKQQRFSSMSMRSCSSVTSSAAPGDLGGAAPIPATAPKLSPPSSGTSPAEYGDIAEASARAAFASAASWRAAAASTAAAVASTAALSTAVRWVSSASLASRISCLPRSSSRATSSSRLAWRRSYSSKRPLCTLSCNWCSSRMSSSSASCASRNPPNCRRMLSACCSAAVARSSNSADTATCALSSFVSFETSPRSSAA